MKDLLEIIGGVLVLVTILALFFVFDGSPDLWDKWHKQAMENAECKQ